MDWNSKEGRLLKLSYQKYVETGIPLFDTRDALDLIGFSVFQENELFQLLRKLEAGHMVTLQLPIGRPNPQTYLLSDYGKQICQNSDWNASMLATGLNLVEARQKAKRKLEILEEQAAGYTGLTVPVNLVIDLEDARNEWKRLEKLSQN